jgi:hypothetical protein
MRFPRAAGAGNDDGLGVARLSLQPDGFLHNSAEGRRVLMVGGPPGGGQGQRVPDVAIGIDTQDNRADVRLKKMEVLVR